MRRLLLLALLLHGCTDIGEVQQRAPHAGKRATLHDDLQTLLAVPLDISCERLVLALSPDYRKELRVTGTGPFRLSFRSLTVTCRHLALSVHPEKTAYLHLMAAGDVQVKRVETRFTADLLLIEDGRMTYAGQPKIKIEWKLPSIDRSAGKK